MFSWPSKAPDEVLDYSIDWSARLVSGDRIIDSNWTISPNTLVVDSNSSSNTVTTVWLSGGTINKSYSVKNIVSTINGRIMDQD